MRHHRASLSLVTLTAGVLLSACNVTDGPLVHHMDVAVTAETRTITEGKLTATLLGYDPNIADKPADTLDVQELTLQHRQGMRTTKAVTLSAEVPEGFETYVSVDGYERQNGVWERILWDGLEGTRMPAQVEMQLLPEETPEGQRLEESLTDWRVLKEANGGDYQYEVLFGSWTGYTTTTTLEVRDDEVVLRRYEARDAEGQITESWTETGNKLGSHENGEPLRTIEELYAICRYEVLTQDRDENDIFLEFRDDGVLEYCQYVPKNCADDCFMGVSIDEIRFLGEPEAFAISTDKSAYVARCTDDGFLEATESAYDPIWACVGHDDQIRVDPSETRTDVLEISGPNSFDGVTQELYGVVEGGFQLLYDAYACAEEGNCDRLPEAQRFSAPFKVTVSGPGADDAGE